MSLSIMLLLIRLTFLFIAISFTAANRCDVDCGPHGVCLPNKKYNCTTATDCPWNCQCRPMFTGQDCSTPVVFCPEAPKESSPTDVKECYNGGVCEEYEDENQRIGIRCNCQSAAGDQSVFAGKQCEYAAQVVCEQDQHFSSYSFCVNGGTCKETVVPGKPHVGCNCPHGYVGRHCEYRKGQEPYKDIHYVDKNKFGAESDAPQPGIIVLIVLLVLSSIACIGCFYIRRRRRSTSSGKEDAAATAASTTSATTKIEDIEDTENPEEETAEVV